MGKCAMSCNSLGARQMSLKHNRK